MANSSNKARGGMAGKHHTEAAKKAVGDANRRDGNEWLTTDGYVAVSAHWHPHARKNGTVLKHRLVMEQRLGRFLLPSEKVHHKDGNKTNNVDDNLELTSNSAHSRMHAAGKRYSRATRNKQAAAHRRVWANMTPEQRAARLRGFNSDDQRRAALVKAREKLAVTRAQNTLVYVDGK